MMNLVKSDLKIRMLGMLVLYSWLGVYLHNYMELRLPLYRWENMLPAVLGVALFLGWWRQPQRRKLWGWLLLTCTVLVHSVAGALLSVLPLPMWAFYPEQSLWHYSAHLIYGLAQLPLIWFLWKEMG